MWRRRVGAVVLVLVALASCGGDDEDDGRTIAFVRTTPIAQESHDAFLAALADAGWEEGDNLTVLNGDPASGVQDRDEAAALVADAVADGADLVVALSTTAALGAVDAGGDVPVLTLTNDPVATGLVDDPRSPSGSVTGVAFRVPADRTIDVARQLAGEDATVGLLFPSDDPGAAPVAEAMTEAADALGVALVAESWTGDDVTPAVGRLVAAAVDVVVVVSSPSTVEAFPAIEAATAAAGIPVVANTRTAEFAVVVLAPESITAYEQLAAQAARLLDGTDVADVPVEDPGGFNLLVRRTVADALGFAVPDDLLAQADEVA